MVKRLHMADDDIELFESIKYKLKASTDVEVLRRLMQYFVTSEWIKTLFEDLKKEVLLSLQCTHQGPSLKYLSL